MTTSALQPIRRQIQAGFLLRGSLRREIEGFLFQRGLEYSIREDKGLLDSVYYLSFQGTRADARALDAFIAELVELNTEVSFTLEREAYKALAARLGTQLEDKAVVSRRGFGRRYEIHVSLRNARHVARLLADEGFATTAVDQAIAAA